MKSSFGNSAFQLLAATTLALAAPFSMAGGSDVSWSISIGSPYPAPQVVAPPPVIYVQPQPVYVRPRPVYVQPAPVVHYGPVYYVEEVRYAKPRHRHWKRHHDRRHDH